MAGLGIARANDVDLLTEAGADLVVTSLDDVDRALLEERRLPAVERQSRGVTLFPHGVPG